MAYFSLPDSAPTGLYDFIATVPGIPKPLRFEKAFLVHDTTQMPWIPTAGNWDTASFAYWPWQPGSQQRLLIPNDLAGCSEFSAQSIRMPTSATVSPLAFYWNPTLSDTGTHWVELKIPPTCGGGSLFGAIQVEASQVLKLRDSKRPVPFQANQQASYQIRYAIPQKTARPRDGKQPSHLIWMDLNGKRLKSDLVAPSAPR
jgi:hypothetical protein